ncbi:MAG: helix-turn-helix domain-containing protein [Desulfobaccales bacterium]
MAPENIKRELWERRRTISMASIARDLGVTRQAIESVIMRRFKSRRIMDAVAQAIGHDVKYVFPELIKPA